MLMAVAAVLIGLAMLSYGADRFIDGASALARVSGMSALMVGVVVVGFATSAPEMLVSAVAALDGNPVVGIGNALGSNVANIGLVIGATAVVCPLAVQPGSRTREFPLMFVALAIGAGMLLDQRLGALDAIVLLVSLLVLMAVTLRISGGDPGSMPPPAAGELSLAKAIFWLLVGLALLLIGSKALVSGAVDIARALGISDVVIGLTIVAIGTSLPELAASLTSALKNQPDMALGNILGSNMFNILGVLAMPGLLAPTAFGAEVIYRDVPIMIGLSALLYLMALSGRGAGVITRGYGAVLLTAFVVYQALLFTQGHAGT
ncbi:MAG: calcium/sodium antiporter [Pseudomonadota bacterium]